MAYIKKYFFPPDKIIIFSGFYVKIYSRAETAIGKNLIFQGESIYDGKIKRAGPGGRNGD